MPRPADADAPVFTVQDSAAAPAVPVSAAETAAVVEEGKEVDARWGHHHHHHSGGYGGYGNYGSGYNTYGTGYNTGYNNYGYGTGYNNYGTGLLGWREGQKEGAAAVEPTADAGAQDTAVPSAPIAAASSPVAAHVNNDKVNF
jgi:hypothetical protein